MSPIVFIVIASIILLCIRIIYANQDGVEDNDFNFWSIIKEYYQNSIKLITNNQIKILVSITITLIFLPHVFEMIKHYNSTGNIIATNSRSFISLSGFAERINLGEYITSSLRIVINNLNFNLYDSIINNKVFMFISFIIILLFKLIDKKLQPYIEEDNEKIFLLIKKVLLGSLILLGVFIIINFYGIKISYSSYGFISTVFFLINKLILNNFIIKITHYIIFSILLGFFLFVIKDIIDHKGVDYIKAFNNSLEILRPMIILNILLMILIPGLIKPIYYSLRGSYANSINWSLIIYFTLKGLILMFLFSNFYVLVLYKKNILKTFKYSTILMIKNLFSYIVIFLSGLVLLFIPEVLSIFLGKIIKTGEISNISRNLFNLIKIGFGIIVSCLSVIVNFAIFSLICDIKSNSKFEIEG